MQPNIIFIITDQQRYETINALGYSYMDTPNLDRLVNEGVTFENCHITAPSCAPSRASLFTGYYPHVTGIMRNADTWQHSWVELLNEAGYHCVNIGKMHTVPWETPLGFHERYVVENKDRYLEARYYFDEWDKALAARGMTKQQREKYRLREDYRERMGAFTWDMPPETQSDNFVGEMAQWWLKSYPKTEPLFMQIGFPGPHPPYDPTPDVAESYMDKEFPLPNVTQEELDGQPPPYQQLREHNFKIDHDSVVHLEDPSREQLHRLWAYYCANVTMIDTQVGKILETLDSEGYLDNSIVIFTSDHGDCIGSHGHIQKWTMYDIITRVPTIFWSSNGQFKAGERVSDQIQLMDVGQAILELASVTPPETMQTISLTSALQGDHFEGRDYVFAEHPYDGIYEGPYMTMIRSDKWKLVHFAGEAYGQLIDLENDPDELHNLWDNPDHIQIKQELLTAMLDWRTTSAHQTRNLFAEHR